jgi:hypothetical protein
MESNRNEQSGIDAGNPVRHYSLSLDVNILIFSLSFYSIQQHRILAHLEAIFASRTIQDLTWRNMKGDERYSPNQARGIIREAKNPNLGCRNPDSLAEPEVTCPNRKNPRRRRHGLIVASSNSGRPKFQSCVMESSSEVRGMFPKENMLCGVWDANYNCVSICLRLLLAAKIVRSSVQPVPYGVQKELYNLGSPRNPTKIATVSTILNIFLLVSYKIECDSLDDTAGEPKLDAMRTATQRPIKIRRQRQHPPTPTSNTPNNPEAVTNNLNRLETFM